MWGIWKVAVMARVAPQKVCTTPRYVCIMGKLFICLAFKEPFPDSSNYSVASNSNKSFYSNAFVSPFFSSSSKFSCTRPLIFLGMAIKQCVKTSRSSIGTIKWFRACSTTRKQLKIFKKENYVRLRRGNATSMNMKNFFCFLVKFCWCFVKWVWDRKTNFHSR